MATRSATLYQGEDMAPVIDYTDYVIWEESEFGTRAYLGEGSGSTVIIRDPLGEQGSSASLPSGLTSRSLAAKNLFTIKVGSDFLFRGRVGIKNYSRDGQRVERYRQVECELHDTNWDLDNIFVHNYYRPAETDTARVQGLIASYLSGYPRFTTALNGSNYLSGSNTVALAAQTYTRTTPLGVLREIATTANKQFFVTGDATQGGSLFYDGNDSTAYTCTLSISDRATEVNHTTVFPPIWNVGAASTEDGSQMIDEVVLFYGTGEDQYVTAHSMVVHTQYGHASETVTDDKITSAAHAAEKAASILAHRRVEDKTYNVTIGPLTDAQVVLVKHGQLINIKARAIPDADDASKTMRIVQCRYTTPVPGTWFAHLQLGRPWKMQPYGTGPTLGPQPAPTTIPDTPGTAIASWTWNTNNLDTQTGTIACLTKATAGYYAPAESAFGSGAYGRNSAGSFRSQRIGVSAATDYTFNMDLLWQYDPSIRNVVVEWQDVTQTIIGAAETIVTGAGHSVDVKYPDQGATLTSPAGAVWAVLNFSSFAGLYADNLTVSTAGVPAVNDPYAVPDGGSSPYYARSDDPRFDNLAAGIDTLTPHEATANPAVTDDETEGFIIGSLWVNTTSDEAFIAVDVTDGAAVWDSMGGGAPTTADYLVGTASGSLSAEIVVGTSPGGELGGTWASPTVDTTHSGSTHSAATDTHIADTTDAHDASAISVLDTGGNFTGTDVEAVLAELDAAISAGGIPATIVDAKGDLIAATAADTVARLAAGANGASLVAASGEATGLKWRKHNDAAAAAPAVTDDSSAGYEVGSRWIDTTADKEYACLDASVGAAVWTETTGTGGGSYTDEQAQDAVGTILTDSATVDFTYTDATPAITAAVIPTGIKLDDLGTPDDNLDLNASTTAHGLLPKLSGTATQYMDGSGAWSTPAGGGGQTVELIASHSTTISVPNSTDTVMLFDSETVDPNGVHSTASNTGRITFVSGVESKVVRITARISVEAAAVQWQFWLRGSGGYAGIKVRHVGSTAGVTTATLVQTFYASQWPAAYYFEIIARQSSGASRTAGNATADANNYVEVVSG